MTRAPASIVEVGAFSGLTYDALGGTKRQTKPLIAVPYQALKTNDIFLRNI